MMTPPAPAEPAANETEITEEIAATADSANFDVADHADLPDEDRAHGGNAITVGNTRNPPCRNRLVRRRSWRRLTVSQIDQSA